MQHQQDHVTQQPKQRFEALTSMRFIAASCIVTMHLAGHFGFPADMTLAGRLPWHQAVAFFFVLSGFILTHAYPSLGTASELRRFFVARIARVWPGHLFAMLVWVWLALCIAKTGTGEVRPLLANMSMIHAWVPRQRYYGSGNLVSWSISTEFGFYLLFPLLLLSLRRSWLVNVLATLGISILLMAICNVWSIPYESARGITTSGLLYMNPLARVFEFACGMAGAVLFKNLERRYRVQPWVATLAEAGILSGVALFAWYSMPLQNAIGSTLNVAPHVMLWFGCGGGIAIPFTILIVLFALGRGWISRMLACRWMVLLGEASYSIYLLHFLLIIFFYYKIERWNISSNLKLVMYVLLLLILSICSWKFIETPLRKWILEKYGRKRGARPAATNAGPVTR